jgi:hypothetical protein
MDIESHPVLSGPAGFTLVAIVVALAAYLRLVSATARAQIERIISGEDRFWIVGKP